jgi:hypothetical protein
MPPIGDERDSAAALAWGLGPPIEGTFGRTIVSELLVFILPVPTTLLVFSILFSQAWAQLWPYVSLGTIMVAAMPILQTLGALSPGGVAATVQVGTKGVGLARRTRISHQLLRSCWVTWEELRLDPKGFGDRWGRTMHLYNGDDDGAPHLVDYNQARQILNRPESRGVLTTYPPWLEGRLGISRAVTVVRA